MSWERDEAAGRVSEPHDRRPEESDPNAVVPPVPKMSDEDHLRRHAKLRAVKQNAMLLAAHHKQHCEGKTCNISLSLLAELMVMAGLRLTDEDRRALL